MFTREQADHIARHLLKDAKASVAQKITILRENRLFPLVAILLLFLVSSWHFYSTIPIWVYIVVALLMGFIIFITSYQYRHPLAEINWICCNYYGYWPWSKQIIPMKEILQISFISKTRFSQSHRILLIHHSGGQLSIELPGSPDYSARQFEELLTNSFNDYFREELGLKQDYQHN